MSETKKVEIHRVPGAQRVTRIVTPRAELDLLGDGPWTVDEEQWALVAHRADGAVEARPAKKKAKPASGGGEL